MDSTAAKSERDSSLHATSILSKKRKSSKGPKKSRKKVALDHQPPLSQIIQDDKEIKSDDEQAERESSNPNIREGTINNSSLLSDHDSDNKTSDGEEDTDPVKNSYSAGHGQTSTQKPGCQTTSQATSFEPPSGFKKDIFDSTSTDTQIFSDSNLEGKQIWYFTAPVLMSISALKEVSIAAIQSGTPVVQHEDDKYRFFSEPVDCRNPAKVLIPKATQNRYGIVSKPVTRILHLQQIIELPGVAGSSKKEKEQRKKSLNCTLARPQPKGLRMRFHPIGTGSNRPETIGSSSCSENETSDRSDVEMKETSPTFKPPPSLSESHRSKDFSPKSKRDKKISKSSHEARNSSHKRKKSSGDDKGSKIQRTSKK